MQIEPWARTNVLLFIRLSKWAELSVSWPEVNTACLFFALRACGSDLDIVLGHSVDDRGGPRIRKFKGEDGVPETGHKHFAASISCTAHVQEQNNTMPYGTMQHKVLLHRF